MTSFRSGSAPCRYARRCSASTTDGSTIRRRGTAPARTVGSSQRGSTPDGRGCRLTFPSRATSCRAKQPRERCDRCRRDPTTRPRPPRLAPFPISGESRRTIASLAQRRLTARLLLTATRSRRAPQRDERKATHSGVSQHPGGRLPRPGDAQAESRYADGNRRAAAFLGRETPGSPLYERGPWCQAPLCLCGTGRVCERGGRPPAGCRRNTVRRAGEG